MLARTVPLLSLDNPPAPPAASFSLVIPPGYNFCPPPPLFVMKHFRYATNVKELSGERPSPQPPRFHHEHSTLLAFSGLPPSLPLLPIYQPFSGVHFIASRRHQYAAPSTFLHM